MSNPFVSIGLVTYKRTDMALLTVKSTIENLQYPKNLRGWYIADDGSPPEHIKAILDLLEGNGETIIGSHSERLRHKGQENTHNAGLGWNKCLGICHQRSDFVLWLEDDWELDAPFDLIPYVQLLRDRDEVGICAFRILTTGADIHTTAHAGQMYFRYDRTTQYAFSGNPYLRHARYTKDYGWFAEDRNPGMMELHQDDMYRYRDGGEGKFIPREKNDGAQIWRPVNISVWGAWKHVGNIKTWE